MSYYSRYLCKFAMMKTVHRMVGANLGVSISNFVALLPQYRKFHPLHYTSFVDYCYTRPWYTGKYEHLHVLVTLKQIFALICTCHDSHMWRSCLEYFSFPYIYLLQFSTCKRHLKFDAEVHDYFRHLLDLFCTIHRQIISEILRISTCLSSTQHSSVYSSQTKLTTCYPRLSECVLTFPSMQSLLLFIYWLTNTAVCAFITLLFYVCLCLFFILWNTSLPLIQWTPAMGCFFIYEVIKYLISPISCASNIK